MRSRRRQGRVRIIGGEWRSRPLQVADVDGLRPTPDRVRETVFNWLAPSLPGARVLDAFAGTGAMAFEALSRGARHAVLLERDPRAVAALQANRQALGADCEIVRADAYAWLAAPNRGEPFDIVLLDPPFADGGIGRLCTLLLGNRWLVADGRVYVEQARDDATQPGPAWQTLKQKTAGQVRFGLFAPDGDTPAAEQ